MSEARDADLLLHVIDAADPLREERIAQVNVVLEEIGAGDIPQLLVYNKIDRIGMDTPPADITDPPGQTRPEGMQPRRDIPDQARQRVWLSARDRQGLDLLHEALADVLGMRRVQGDLRLPPDAGRLRARLHALDAIRGEAHDETGWTLAVDLAEVDAMRLAAEIDGAPLRCLLPAAPCLRVKSARPSKLLVRRAPGRAARFP